MNGRTKYIPVSINKSTYWEEAVKWFSKCLTNPKRSKHWLLINIFTKFNIFRADCLTWTWKDIAEYCSGWHLEWLMMIMTMICGYITAGACWAWFSTCHCCCILCSEQFHSPLQASNLTTESHVGKITIRSNSQYISLPVKEKKTISMYQCL